MKYALLALATTIIHIEAKIYIPTIWRQRPAQKFSHTKHIGCIVAGMYMKLIADNLIQQSIGKMKIRSTSLQGKTYTFFALLSVEMLLFYLITAKKTTSVLYTHATYFIYGMISMHMIDFILLIHHNFKFASKQQSRSQPPFNTADINRTNWNNPN